MRYDVAPRETCNEERLGLTFVSALCGHVAKGCGTVKPRPAC